MNEGFVRELIAAIENGLEVEQIRRVNAQTQRALESLEPRFKKVMLREKEVEERAARLKQKEQEFADALADKGVDAVKDKAHEEGFAEGYRAAIEDLTSLAEGNEVYRDLE